MAEISMGKTNNLIFLWCVPRSVSTAFEKMMDSSGIFKVHGEPFIDLYKKSLLSEVDYRKVQVQFNKECRVFEQESRTQAVFIKDMAYHALPFISDELICSATHSFLIRDPRYSIPSLFKMRPDFAEEQTGFEGQYKLFNKIKKLTGQYPHVVDAEELKQKPDSIVSDFFDYIGYEFQQDIMSWHQGTRDDWSERESWHITAINSTGFENKKREYNPDILPGRVLKLIKKDMNFYDYLRQFVTPN